MGIAKATLSDGDWVTLFGRYHAGEPARTLIAEYRINKGVFDAEARRRRMRRCDLPPGHPGRWRHPPKGERSDDFVHPAGTMSEGDWKALLMRWLAGESGRALALEYGVTQSAIQRQARDRGMLKRDHPGSKRAPRGRTAMPRGYRTQGGSAAAVPGADTPSAAVAFDFDQTDAAATARSLGEQVRAALKEGRLIDATALCRTKVELDRAFFAPSPSWGGTTTQRSRWEQAQRSGSGGVGLPHPVAVGDHPPPEGEGEASGLVLRRSQTPPEGDWSTWLFLGGRGAGKTLAGASWISDMAERCGRLALVGATLHDAREVMIGGPSGILSLPRWRAVGDWPVYQASRRRLVFPNGAEAFVFSAEDPDSLRGPQFAAAWADEFCAWRAGGEVLALLRMGLRLTGSGAPGANARARGASLLERP